MGRKVQSGDRVGVEDKILIIGDSQVRYLDSAFCNKDRKNRTRVCMPGARIGDVVDKLGKCLAGEGVKPVVCLSAGGNDVGNIGSEELFRRCKMALGRIQNLGAVPVMCGVLPRTRAGGRWLSYALALNCRLAEHCKSNGWRYIDHWDLFWGKDKLYTQDGIHLSREGVEVFAGALEGQVGKGKEFFR